MKRLLPTILLVLLTLSSSNAYSCPKIGKLIDYNCDGEHKIVAVGDSVVRGFGDAYYNNNGGYVKRVARKLKNSTVVNLGKPGYTVIELLSFVKGKLEKRRASQFKTDILDADILIVDVGRNDYFDEADAPLTENTIERLVDYLKTALGRDDHITPIIGVAKLTPTTRGFQRSFIADVNHLLDMFNSPNLPIRLNFDTIDEELISVDGIHPASPGYAAMSKIALEYIKGSAQTESLIGRDDLDNDGIYDVFETSKFKTNPAKDDTDDDGLIDGDEIFRYNTKARNPDTDADGVSDGVEISLGTDPLVAFL